MKYKCMFGSIFWAFWKLLSIVLKSDEFQPCHFQIDWWIALWEPYFEMNKLIFELNRTEQNESNRTLIHHIYLEMIQHWIFIYRVVLWHCVWLLSIIYRSSVHKINMYFFAVFLDEIIASPVFRHLKEKKKE